MPEEPIGKLSRFSGCPLDDKLVGEHTRHQIYQSCLAIADREGFLSNGLLDHSDPIERADPGTCIHYGRCQAEHAIKVQIKLIVIKESMYYAVGPSALYKCFMRGHRGPAQVL